MNGDTTHYDTVARHDELYRIERRSFYVRCSIHLSTTLSTSILIRPVSPPRGALLHGKLNSLLARVGRSRRSHRASENRLWLTSMRASLGS